MHLAVTIRQVETFVVVTVFRGACVPLCPIVTFVLPPAQCQKGRISIVGVLEWSSFLGVWLLQVCWKPVSNFGVSA